MSEPCEAQLSKGRRPRRRAIDRGRREALRRRHRRNEAEE